MNKTVYENHAQDARYRELGDVSMSLNASLGTGGNNQRLVVASEEDQVECYRVKDGAFRTDVSVCIDTNGNDPSCCQGENLVMTLQAFGDYEESETASSLKQRDYKDATDLVCRDEGEKTVRRLTPLECERLQGFPDGWTDIPGASDSARYRALGNSIALPFWEHLAHRFADLGGVQTIGSLFDGIGGFPLVFQRAGAETLWTSEIEPFCRKVTAFHFGEEQ